MRQWLPKSRGLPHELEIPQIDLEEPWEQVELRTEVDQLTGGDEARIAVRQGERDVVGHGSDSRRGVPLTIRVGVQ